MPIKNITVAITSVTSDKLQPAGIEFEHEDATWGPRVWKYVQNTEGTAWVIGNVISRDAAVAGPGFGERCPANTHANRVIGVAQHAVPAGYWAFIMRSGCGAEVLADAGGVTVDLALICGDAVGTADAAATVEAPAFGVASETVASGLATCMINCLG